MPELKPTNPKDALGIKKVPFHCIPSAPLLEVGLAMMEGGRKYGAHNYRAIGVRVSAYYDAIMRHLIAWWEGEDIDPDSGVHHIVKAMACLFVLRDSMFMENYKDDRPIKYPKGLKIDRLNKLAEALIEKYPECVEPFLEKAHPAQEQKLGDFCSECTEKIKNAKNWETVTICENCTKKKGR